MLKFIIKSILFFPLKDSIVQDKWDPLQERPYGRKDLHREWTDEGEQEVEEHDEGRDGAEGSCPSKDLLGRGNFPYVAGRQTGQCFETST